MRKTPPGRCLSQCGLCLSSRSGHIARQVGSASERGGSSCRLQSRLGSYQLPRSTLMLARPGGRWWLVGFVKTAMAPARRFAIPTFSAVSVVVYRGPPSLRRLSASVQYRQANRRSPTAPGPESPRPAWRRQRRVQTLRGESAENLAAHRLNAGMECGDGVRGRSAGTECGDGVRGRRSTSRRRVARTKAPFVSSHHRT